MTQRGMLSVLALALAAAMGAALFFNSERAQTTATARASASASAVGPAASAPDAPARLAPRAPNPCDRCAECPAGMRPETVEGECCPRCVAADQQACERGKARYEDRYAQLEAELRACSVDDDCMVASFSDACRASCPLPLNKQNIGSVVARLQEAAAVHCQACAPERFECPRLATNAARCVGGRCEFAAGAAGPTARGATAVASSP